MKKESAMESPLLDVRNLGFSFKTYGGCVQAVRGVSFYVNPGEVVGIVGESGCGKSVSAQCVLRLNPEPPGFFTGGSIRYKRENLLEKNAKELRRIRGTEVGFVFQDPMTFLNPTMKIGAQVREVFVGRPGDAEARGDIGRRPPARPIPPRTFGRHEAARHDRHGPRG